MSCQTRYFRCAPETSLCKPSGVVAEDPYSGRLFVCRGRQGDLSKIIWWDSQGACLFSKRLEQGRFVCPGARSGKLPAHPT
ncbi:IS66 family insertion sequence element accessory protein TnpB [Rhodobacterales bacterium]|nr:IS66 family insertion sequence element accessory protein TnpB [Rhodobacterales bacterium]